MALLVHLDRVDGRVATAVLVLARRAIEALGERFDARAEDVREPEKEGQANALSLEVVRELEEVELAGRIVGIRTDDDVSFVVDVEIAYSPALDVVEVPG